MYEPGIRVEAIVSANVLEVKLFGYGVYQGDEIPPLGIIGPFGEMNQFGIRNPKIQLDSGEVVWGCECWWGPEDKVKTIIGTRTIKLITPSQYRKSSYRKRGMTND